LTLSRTNREKKISDISNAAKLKKKSHVSKEYLKRGFIRFLLNSPPLRQNTGGGSKLTQHFFSLECLAVLDDYFNILSISETNETRNTRLIPLKNNNNNNDDSRLDLDVHHPLMKS